MRHALVVYESMWGNSEQIARAIAQGVGEFMRVDVVEAGSAPTELADIELVVAGGPTHVFSMSRPRTRREAHREGATQGEDESGLREWLHSLPGEKGRWFAAFDTKVTRRRHVPGSASHSAKRASHHHRFTDAIDPESFYVADVDGPVVEGELDRARQWGHSLAASIPAYT